MGSTPTLPESGEILLDSGAYVHPRSKLLFDDGQRQARLRWKKRTGFEPVHENSINKCGQGFLSLPGALKKIYMPQGIPINARCYLVSGIICA